METFLKRIPKIELHLHLEGSIPLPALWELIKKYKGDAEFPNYEKFKNKFQYTSFEEFLHNWIWMVQFFNEYEDFTFLTQELFRELKVQNYKYVELFYSPARMIAKGLKPDKLTEAIIKGAAPYYDEIPFAIIPDISRDFGTEQATYIMESISDVKGKYVKGIGMGGSENKFPPEPFAPVFEKARKLGFKTTAHAGENAGPESIWGAINILKVDRVGHGTSAIRDKKLVEYLRNSQLPIELCPVSNHKTGVVKNLIDHPIKTYMDLGLNVSVNTDDPTFFNNPIEVEFQEIVDTFKLTKSEVISLFNNSIRGAWCDDDLKNKLYESFQKFE